jgi:1,4-alpha-glucan branching enzyme
MYAKGKKNGSVSFKVTPHGSVKKAALAGSFSDWKPVAMKKQKDGSFTATVDLAAGRYEYKFILDEQWVHDTDVPGVVANRFGSLNSIAVISK